MSAVSSKDQRLDLPEPTATTAAGPPDETDAAVVERLSTLIRRCWVREPAERPGFGDIITELRLLLNLCRAPDGGSRSRRLSVLRLPSSPNRTSQLAPSPLQAAAGPDEDPSSAPGSPGPQVRCWSVAEPA